MFFYTDDILIRYKAKEHAFTGVVAGGDEFLVHVVWIKQTPWLSQEMYVEKLDNNTYWQIL